MTIIFSCEHGGNTIPEKWAHLFSGAEDILQSHRGYDPGALKIYEHLIRNTSCIHISSTTSRLLVELNRSIHHPRLFSEFTLKLPREQKQEILRNYYTPYRSHIQEAIQTSLEQNKQVLHFSIHTFTPVWENDLRNAEIGLLYDPKRIFEKEFCHNWKKKIFQMDASLRIRMNYPYNGTADGLTTYLRKLFPEGYSGIEVEVNQGLMSQEDRVPFVLKLLKKTLSSSLSEVH